MPCGEGVSVTLRSGLDGKERTHKRPTENMAMRAVFCFFDMFSPMSEATGRPSNAKSEMTLKMIGIATCQFAEA